MPPLRHDAVRGRTPESGKQTDSRASPLTAPRTLDFADVAGILGDLTGRTVTRVVMDDDEWTSAAVAGGMSRPVAEFALTMFAASRNGEFNTTDPTLEATVGHPARTVQEVLETALRTI
ncbi:hypothetical protein AB0D91_01290 [Streptomyces canus]|uniref:hypothetical protein n=1 Tax=Streptomyces canus TaxID=58343 RepID=UPI003402BF62